MKKHEETIDCCDNAIKVNHPNKEEILGIRDMAISASGYKS